PTGELAADAGGAPTRDNDNATTIFSTARESFIARPFLPRQEAVTDPPPVGGAQDLDVTAFELVSVDHEALGREAHLHAARVRAVPRGRHRVHVGLPESRALRGAERDDTTARGPAVEQ